MKKIMVLFMLFFLICGFAFSQNNTPSFSDPDTDGTDIWLPKPYSLKNIIELSVDPDEAMPYYHDMVVVVLSECIITYAVSDDVDIPDIFTPKPVDPDTDGIGGWLPCPLTVPNASGGGDGPMTKPPGCGYQGTVSDPTKSGCDYVTFSGTDKDGNSFSVTAQVYFPKGTPTGEKCKEISNELNNQSDNTTNDPIVSSAAPSTGTFIVQPAAGGKITSAEWDNGSGEENNSLEEIFGPDKEKTSGTRIKGFPTGVNSNGEPSSIMIGMGRIKVHTYLEVNENHVAILSRLKYGLTFLGIEAKLGFDSSGVHWLIWDNPSLKSRMGSNDTGIDHMIVSDRSAPSLKENKNPMKVGRYDISFF